MSVAHALVSRLRASSASRVQTGEAPAQATALLKSLEAAHALTENLRAQRRGKEMRDVNRKLRSKHGTVFLVDPFQRPAVARPKTARGRWRRAIGKVQTMHRWKKVLHRGTPVSKALAGQPAAAGDTDDEAEATGVATTAHVSSALTNDALSMLESMTAAHAAARAEGETTGDAAVRRNGKDAVPPAEASLAAVMVESGAVRTMASLLRQPSGDTAARAMRVFSEAARLGAHSVETLDDAGAATGNVVVKAPVLEAMIQQGVAPAIAEGLDAHATSREYTSQAFAFLADAATMPGRDITSLGLTLGSLRSIQAAHKYVGGVSMFAGDCGPCYLTPRSVSRKFASAAPGSRLDTDGQKLIVALSEVYAEASGARFSRELAQAITHIEDCAQFSIARGPDGELRFGVASVGVLPEAPVEYIRMRRSLAAANETSRKVKGASVPSISSRTLVILTSALERFAGVVDVGVVECLCGLLQCLSSNQDNECDGYLLRNTIPAMVAAFASMTSSLAVARAYTSIVERLSHDPDNWPLMPSLGATKVGVARARTCAKQPCVSRTCAACTRCLSRIRVCDQRRPSCSPWIATRPNLRWCSWLFWPSRTCSVT